MPTPTPWGRATESEAVVRGVMIYQATSDGGIHLANTINRSIIPDEIRNKSAECADGWYRDSNGDWSIAVMFLEDAFREHFTLTKTPAYAEEFIDYARKTSLEIFGTDFSTKDPENNSGLSSLPTQTPSAH